MRAILKVLRESFDELYADKPRFHTAIGLAVVLALLVIVLF